jgi:hypothetical protein
VTKNSVEFLDLLNRFEQAAVANHKWGWDFKPVSRLYAEVRAEVETQFGAKDEMISRLEERIRALEGA